MKDYSKAPASGMKPAVRQIKGPGMNRGLKKRHKPAAPKPYTKRRSKKTATSSGLVREGFF